MAISDDAAAIAAATLTAAVIDTEDADLKHKRTTYDAIQHVNAIYTDMLLAVRNAHRSSQKGSVEPFE